jgi:hypothetical protein
VIPTELELIAARDVDAMARFYDRHGAAVRQFCAAVCPAARVEEAVEAALVDFLARATVAAEGGVPETLLSKSTREVAASRMELEAVAAHEALDPICRAMPELLAARANGELSGPQDPLVDHLQICSLCETTAARLEYAEIAFAGWPSVDADDETGAEPAAGHRSTTAAPAVPQAVEPLSLSERPAPVRVRRGGLVGAAKRLARSRAASSPERADRGR